MLRSLDALAATDPRLLNPRRFWLCCVLWRLTS